MRGIVLAVVAIQVGLTFPAWAENSADLDRSIGETLPLFDRNHCGAFKDPAEQLFCGDPELNGAAARLNSAIQERLNRIPNSTPRDRGKCGMDQRTQFKLRYL